MMRRRRVKVFCLPRVSADGGSVEAVMMVVIVRLQARRGVQVFYIVAFPMRDFPAGGWKGGS